MSFGDTMRNIGEGIKNAAVSAHNARETRLSNPAFQAEMTREKAELRGRFGNTAEHAFNTGSSIIMDGVLKPLASPLKLLADKKYKWYHAFFDVGAAPFKVGWSGLKLGASLALTAGKMTKIAGRWLIAK